MNPTQSLFFCSLSSNLDRQTDRKTDRDTHTHLNSFIPLELSGYFAFSSSQPFHSPNLLFVSKLIQS